ncbi:epoxyqueuosine reductase [Fusibacter tunisiensis]|uniref:Epoxyqueuosine reductase n=1 Tax=Fusibacter tunisiensis TaxID=1008308 RepID=A0ABS2MRZ8_9FIRM|nr:4Fe-4S double cluster binding domain-containing protein [Fusibacter tunisiensis]MBM7562177.1 epoxyqueuosine reductase [Fusibacter tunisiensis]
MTSIEKIFSKLKIDSYGILELTPCVKKTIYDREVQLESWHQKRKISEFEPEGKNRFLVLNRDHPAQTIVAIAIPFDLKGMVGQNTLGWVDPSAWARDYHAVLKQLLLEIHTHLKTVLNRPLETPEYCVDTTPYIDREVALYTGLGKYGKNHFMINPKHGTHFYIGYLLYKTPLRIGQTSLDLTNIRYDGCETCDACVHACPSQICSFGEMDVTKCLSAITQTGFTRTDSDRELLKNRLYGCNTCQLVCPANKDKGVYEALQIESKNYIDPFELLCQSNKMFKRQYGGQGFAWRHGWIYKRNALNILGNTGDLTVYNRLKEMTFMRNDDKLKWDYQWALKALEKVIY